MKEFLKNTKIAIIGLGYVGLPLARLFATKYPVVGFDINKNRIQELNHGHDGTNEVSDALLKEVRRSEAPNQGDKGLFCTSTSSEIKDCTLFIITVPTPVDANNKVVLIPLIEASKTVAAVLKKGDIVIYESTVYPGVTEDECVPVLEQYSELIFNTDFFVGYSPERINPGDKLHSIEHILKVTSGSTSETATKVDALYQTIITAGTHKAPSIKVAEASKVIENSQRDINIAFMNELAKIFGLMNLDTKAVLEAAATKWNFLPFTPGLVGGHCIGVDPYYLAQKAQELGYNPGIILAGRRMNDSMGAYVASEVVKMMLNADIPVKNAKVLVLGITFKENCPDIRNTKVVDVISSLKEYGMQVDVYDPWANTAAVLKTYQLVLRNTLASKKYDTIVLTVAHTAFETLNFEDLLSKEGVIYDVKGVVLSNRVKARL